VAGALAACGMNIGKAGAFSNAGGTVVDTFSFTDRYRRLEMNLPEWERFKAPCTTCSPESGPEAHACASASKMEKDRSRPPPGCADSI
jgi:hypothetical protein